MIHRHSRRWQLFVAVFLILTILLAFALRLHNLDQFSFWTDEGLTPERSGYALLEIFRNSITIQGVETKDTHPPLYYLIIHFSRQVFGESDFAFRYPSVLFGVLLVPLLFQFGRALGRRDWRLETGDWRLGDWEIGRLGDGRQNLSVSQSLSLLVSFLAAVNPLQVYYAQEARMYTLLVLLGAGASYVLWRALARDMLWGPNRTRRQLARDLGLYILMAGLAFYTHYTAVFLIAAQSIFWLWLLWRTGLRWWIVGAGMAGVLLAIPLIPYTIPRLFSGAEANYSTVSPLVMLKDVVHFFNLGLTTDFEQFWVRLLDAAALLLLLLGLWAARTWRKRAFLITYLLAVVLGLMAGSLIKPMYQGVRHIMLGSPAFVLLVTLGIGFLGRFNAEGQRGRAGEPGSGGAGGQLAVGSGRWAVGGEYTTYNLQSLVSSLVGMVALVVLVCGAAVSLNNLYNNPAYGKDDFRGLIRYIEQRAGENDVIVYNNAVLLPLHEHYRVRPDVDVTALPVYPQYATGVERELAALAESYDRIWLITDPPADKRDEGRLIQGWLESHLSVVDGRLFAARTTEARTIAYDTGAIQVAELSAASRPLAISWEGLPTLRGVALTSRQPVALPTLWLDLYWEGAMTAEIGVTPLRFLLRGPDGREWETRDRTLLLRWESKRQGRELNRVSYSVPLPVGLPQGEYTIVVQPKDGQEAHPLLTTAVAPTSAWPAAIAEIYSEEAVGELLDHAPAIRFDNGLALQAAVISDVEVRPGHNLPLTLYWQAQQPVMGEGLSYRLEVVGPDGALLREQVEPPGAGWLEAWTRGEVVQENSGLYFYPETEPGVYTLRWSLQNGAEVIAGRRLWRPWSSTTVDFGAVEVRPWPLERALPDDVTVVAADFGTLAQLYGYTLDAENGVIELALTWQVAESTDVSYLVFVHVVPEAGVPEAGVPEAGVPEAGVPEAGGGPVMQADRFPVDNLRPTTGWRMGEVLSDVYTLPLAADLQPGRYSVYVGLYNPDDGQRLPVSLNGVLQLDGRLSLATLELP